MNRICFFVCVILFSVSMLSHAQGPKPSMPERVIILESEVRDLKKQIAELKARLDLMAAKANRRADEPNPLLARPGSQPGMDTGTAPTKIPPSTQTWVVTISSNVARDVSALRHQVNSKTLIEKRVSEKLTGTRERYDYALYRQNKAQIDNALRDVRKAERELKEVSDHISSLEKKIRDSAARRTLTGTTSEGVEVKIIAKGSAALIAQTIQNNRNYTITGIGDNTTGMLIINMTSASLEH